MVALAKQAQANTGLPIDEVIHGDCLAVLRGLPDNCVDAIVTDPPYGIDYQSSRRIDSQCRKAKIANDKHPFIWWLHDAYRVTKMGGAILSFCEWRYQEVFRMAIEAAGFDLRSQVIWDREWHGLGNLQSAFAPQHDVIWFATKGRFAFPNGRPKSVIRAQRISAEKLVHPNEKPVDLMRQLVRAITPLDGIVLDCFSGSGSTCMAAVEEGMHFIGIEQSDEYCSIARDRIAHTT